MVINEDIADISIGADGEVIEVNDKIALIDADTIVFAAACTCEEENECLGDEFYSKAELEEINSDPTLWIDEDGNKFTYTIDLDVAMQHCKDKIQIVLDKTGCKDYELHFTGGGKENFRYKIYDMYKANRKGGRYPTGVNELKKLFVKEGKAEIHYKWEADDAVVAKKRANPDDYILCAIDKDVIYSVPGKHFNYYYKPASVNKYGVSLEEIPMQFIEVSVEESVRHHYHQTLTGDSTDNVPGLHRVGTKTADKILSNLTDSVELWNAVVQAYESRGSTVIDAIVNMRLVNMHQVSWNGEEYSLKLWEPVR